VLDALADFRGRVYRVDPIILQIPADILRVLGRNCKGKRPSFYLPDPIALKDSFRGRIGVEDSQNWHFEGYQLDGKLSTIIMSLPR
jgi:hypothetical protein